MFPPDNVWNRTVDSLPVHSLSKQYLQSIGEQENLHPDFGAGLWQGKPMGIPINIADKSSAHHRVAFRYKDESDPGPYPIPMNPQIEGGLASDGDRHLIVLDQDSAKLYELYNVARATDGGWSAGSGAVFDLRSNALRPAGWTSADAAGLPILPGLVTYKEVASGHIDHAIRFTAPRTQKAYVWPARHFASSSADPALPPMGIRVRLRANFDISKFPQDCQTILKCLKTYGMMLADNGDSWFVSGEPNEQWNNDTLHQLTRVKGCDFEVVDQSMLMLNRDSAACKPAVQ